MKKEGYLNGRELMDKEFPPESGEAAYRRGYRDGMIVAHNEYIGEEITESEYDALFRWMLNGSLFRWMKGAERDSRLILPPEFTRERDLIDADSL